MAGSYKDRRGSWRIPITDLIAAGFEPGRPSPPDAAPDERGLSTVPVAAGSSDAVAGLRRELDEARRHVEETRGRLNLVEQLAAERERHIEDLRTALRQLNPGAPLAGGPQPEEASGSPEGELATATEPARARPLAGPERRVTRPAVANGDPEMAWLSEPATRPHRPSIPSEGDADPHSRSSRRRGFWRRVGRRG